MNTKKHLTLCAASILALTSPTVSRAALAGYWGFDRVSIPITTSLGLTNAFTFSVWAKADSLGSYPFMLLFSNNSDGTARQWFIQGDSSGGDQMYMWSDANTAWRKGLGYKVGGSGTANLNWHNYAFVYSGGVVTPYVDGVAKTAQSV